MKRVFRALHERILARFFRVPALHLRASKAQRDCSRSRIAITHVRTIEMNDAKYTEHEARILREAMGFTEEETPVRERTRSDSARESYDSAEAAVRQADTAARRGDLAGAKHWSDVAKRLSEAAERLASTPPPEPSWEEQEKMRAVLMERISKLAEREEALRRWGVRKEIWDEMAAEAQRTGAPMPSPMPPRPHHWTDDLPDDLRKRLTEDRD
jgi:hypothetical protein